MQAIRTGILAIGVTAGMMAQPAAAPAPPAAPAMPYLWFGQNVGGSYLGVGAVDVDSERAKALNLKEIRGVELTKVEEDSPASKAGLKNGDVVLEYNGQRVEGTEQLLRMLRETPPNREVKLSVSRGGKLESVTLTTGKRKSPATLFTREGQPFQPIPSPGVGMVAPDMPRAMMSWRSGMLGIEAESLEGPLAEYFGVKQGVLVRNVGKETPAEKAGIKAGDVITKVETKDVTSAREVTIAIRALREKDKKTFPVTLMREKKETTLSVTIDEPDAHRAPKAVTPKAQTVHND